MGPMVLWVRGQHKEAVRYSVLPGHACQPLDSLGIFRP